MLSDPKDHTRETEEVVAEPNQHADDVVTIKQDRTIILSLSILAAGLVIAAVVFFRPDLEAAFTQYNAARLANTIHEVPLTEQDRSIGPSSAPVTIVEFSDFSCPFCRSAQPVLDALMDEFGDQVRLVYKDYISVGGQRAAEAAWCADEQGAFWAFHDALFGPDGDLTHDGYITLAGMLGLDVNRFAQCIDLRKYQDRVAAQTAEGAALGVHATPTWFINGKKVTGALEIDAFRAMLIKEGAVAPTQK